MVVGTIDANDPIIEYTNCIINTKILDVGYGYINRPMHMLKMHF